MEESPPGGEASPGALTFLFTDIEGSTELWERETAAMEVALARHDEFLREAIAAEGGTIFKSAGDGFYVVFPAALPAAAAALRAQRSLAGAALPLPLRVRMALYTGEVEARGGDYYGPALNRLARLLAAGHGGQVLLSLPTRELLGDDLPEEASLRDLGLHQFRGIPRPERVFQLLHPDLPTEFPPLRSFGAMPNNLPRQLTSFIGREAESAELRQLVTATPLVTITGTAGCGKTRLAVEVAADLLADCPDGVWLVELAALN